MTHHQGARPGQGLVFVGVDVGGSGVRLVTEASPGGRSAVVGAPTPASYRELVDLIGKLVAETGQGTRPTSTVVGLPGTTSDDRPTWVPALRYLDGRPLAQDLREVLSGPVRLGNDAQMALYGEATEGAARGGRNVVLVTVGTGIGGAVLVEGRILRGAHGSRSGERVRPGAGARLRRPQRRTGPAGPGHRAGRPGQRLPARAVGHCQGGGAGAACRCHRCATRGPAWRGGMAVSVPLPAVDPLHGVPLYLQVEQHLRQRVQSGEWQPGQKIPTEEQMCAAYGVSRVTMRQALARLVDRGLLVRERGRGTFVRDAALTAAARGVTSFTTELAALGLEAGARVLAVEVVPADAATLDALGLDHGAEVVRVHRVRTGNGRPIGIQTSLLPVQRFPNLEHQNLRDRSLYQLLRTHYGVVPVEAVETFTVGGIDTREARLLEVPPQTCAFFVERVTLDARGPFERVTSVMRGDRYRIRLALRNP